jgi:hypothetical protein
MEKIELFLKYLAKTNYPSTETTVIADMIDYNLDDFLMDLENKLGQEGVDNFCKKAIDKLGGSEGIKIDFGNEEYVIVKIEVSGYDEDEYQSDIGANVEILDSKILTVDGVGHEFYTTTDEIRYEADMGDWSEYDEMMDFIRQQIYNYIFYRCGFGIWVP